MRSRNSKQSTQRIFRQVITFSQQKEGPSPFASTTPSFKQKMLENIHKEYFSNSAFKKYRGRTVHSLYPHPFSLTLLLPFKKNTNSLECFHIFKG